LEEEANSQNIPALAEDVLLTGLTREAIAGFARAASAGGLEPKLSRIE
jgi:hypothetical protein